jgi:cobalt-zinc-cadmium efflux system membrane fusion protein
MGARAEVSLARKTREREDRLFAEKITSEQSALEAQTAHEKALVHLRSGEEKLRLLGLSKQEIAGVRYGDPKAATFSLVAPMDGRIVEKHLVAGELVTPEEKVFTVADLTHLWIWIDIYERDLARVHKDDTVVVVTQAWPGRTFDGHVAYIGDRVDPDTRAARARIDIPNPEGALKPGMFAEVVLTDPHGIATRSARRSPCRRRRAPRRGADDRLRPGGRAQVRAPHASHRRAHRRDRRGHRRARPGERVVVEGAFLLKSEAAKEEMGGGHSH